MSWSCGASSAPGFRRAAGRRRGAESRSPVVYRENPMAYEPAKMCNCNPPRKAPRWISWSSMNPGRRYYACVDALNGRGCGYVEWEDGPLPRFFSDLIGDMRDEIWRLRGDEQMPDTDTDVVDEQAATESTLKALQDQLQQKNEEIGAMKGKFESAMYLFVVFVLGVVAGKFVSQ